MKVLTKKAPPPCRVRFSFEPALAGGNLTSAVLPHPDGLLQPREESDPLTNEVLAQNLWRITNTADDAAKY